MESIWNGTCKTEAFSSVDKDLSTHILIIGGGLCGILCAYYLEQMGVDYILVEADRICSKTSANTTAKITSQHGLIYKDMGESKAQLYYEANENAIQEYKNLCKDFDCDFKVEDSFIYTLGNTDKLKKEYEFIKGLGFDAEFCEDVNIPFSAKGAIKFYKQASFNPLKFVSHISKGLNIFENSRVTEMVGTTALVNGHKIKADKVIVTTHFPFVNKHGLYFMKMYQYRSYVISMKTNVKIEGMYISDSRLGLSLRTYKDEILLGGMGHRTGKKSSAWQGLKEIADKYFPGNKITHMWATQDCMTLDNIPYIGNYSSSTPNLYVATGFNKWGMTSSVVGAKILCDLVLDKENKYSRLYSPSRCMIKPQLAINTLEALAGWIYPTAKRCPHLGCALKWNKYEHSWDCSCHGSRFTKSGELLDGPSNKNKVID